MGFLKEIEDFTFSGIDIGDLSVSEYYYGCSVLSHLNKPYLEVLGFLIVRTKKTLEMLYSKDIGLRDDIRIFYIQKRLDVLTALREELAVE
jgi:hypothetical protein